MRKFALRFTAETARTLSKLHPENKKLIKQALKELGENPYAGNDLQEELFGFKSFKLKRFRILYNINEEDNTIRIYHVGHRKDVYQQFHRLLTELKKPS